MLFIEFFLTWKGARNHRGPTGIVGRILNKLHAIFFGKNVELQGQEPLSFWNWKFSSTQYLVIFSTLHDKCWS